MAEKVEVEIKVDSKNAKKEVQGVNKEVQGTKKNAKGFSTAIKGWGKALAASGILLAIAAVVRMLNIAKEAILSNAVVSQEWEQQTFALKSVWSKMADDSVKAIQRLKDKFKEDGGFRGMLERIKETEVGKWFTEAFSSPQKAIKALGTMLYKFIIGKIMGIVDALVGVGKAIKHLVKGEWKELGEAGKDVADGFIRGFTGIEDGFDKIDKATKKSRENLKEYAQTLKEVKQAAEEIKETRQNLIVAEAQIGLLVEKNKQDILKQRVIANDVNKTYEERKKAIEESFRLEMENTKQLQSIEQQKLNLMLQESEFATNTAEENAAIIKQKQKVANLETQRLQRSITWETKLAQLEKQNTTDQLAAASKLKQLKVQNLSDEQERILEQKRLYYENELAKVKNTEHAENIKKQLKIKYENEVAEIKQQFKEEENKALKEQQQLLKELQAENIEDETEQALAKLEINYNKQLLELEQYDNFLELKKELDKKYENDKLEITQEYSAKREKAEIARQQEVFDITTDLLSSLSSFRQSKLAADLKAAEGNEKKQEKLRKEAAEDQKRIAIITAIINTALAISKALADPGGLAGAVYAIAVGVAGAAQIAAISQQSFAKGGIAEFDGGGLAKGPGTGTSDSIPARISNGEAVINAKSTKMFRNQLSAMNVAGGGVPFAKGGIAGSTNSMNELVDQEAIVKAINDQQVIVSETDITRAQKRVKVVESDASL